MLDIFDKATPKIIAQAEYQLSLWESDRTEAQQQLQQARSYFNFLLNRPLSSPIEVDSSLSPTLLPDALGTFQAQARQNRAEYTQLTYAQQAAHAQTSLQRMQALPTVNAVFDLARTNTVKADVAGEYETQRESFGDLGTLLVVAVLGIFAVLILQFRSFSQAFTVLSAIPLALSGSIVALFLTGWTFSFFAFVGFTSLVGIVVNTSIILVDYTNQLRAKGLSTLAAIQQSAETRFTPILLTTLPTIVGLLPLTLTHSGLWSPLGWTLIGGMVSSTLLTLLIVPVLYKWLTPKAA